MTNWGTEISELVFMQCVRETSFFPALVLLKSSKYLSSSSSKKNVPEDSFQAVKSVRQIKFFRNLIWISFLKNTVGSKGCSSELPDFWEGTQQFSADLTGNLTTGPVFPSVTFELCKLVIQGRL